MLASNASLKWVNYPTQVLGKSCKPIPVMILGVFLAGTFSKPFYYIASYIVRYLNMVWYGVVFRYKGKDLVLFL